jgi:mono/diheme cytochrome c family protein
MNGLFDLLLKKPFPDALLQGVLFVTFTFHILFVLLAIGTAILSIYYFIHTWYAGRLEELRWDREILRTFMAHKSLAVVLGVAPLLLIQVGFTVPFFTGVNLLAPFWMLIIPLLIAAFLLFDGLGHKMEVHPLLHLVLGLLALICLLAVPGIFVATLITSENPGMWPMIVQQGYKLTVPLRSYWLWRYLHIIGAAIVFGSAFHFLSSGEDEKNKKASLLKWVVSGILLQFILGIMLYASLPEKAEAIINIALIAGVIAAAALLWVISFGPDANNRFRLKTTVPLLILILVPMLLTRQLIQNKHYLPLNAKLEADAITYDQELKPYSSEALNQYRSNLHAVYDNGEMIYPRSCAFCHGEDARGNGPEAKNLRIPPEDISAVRTTRSCFHRILIDGISGSAMPYFTYFDRDKLESLVSYLNQKYHVIGSPGPLPVQIPKEALEQANKVYAETCSVCHGMDGRGAKLSEQFRPPPPDFSAYSLLPQRTLEVITNGYPGTLMPSFSNLEEEVRWGLVEIVNGKRKMKAPPGREGEPLR